MSEIEVEYALYYPLGYHPSTPGCKKIDSHDDGIADPSL